MVTLKTKTWQLDGIDTVLFDKDGTFIDLHYFWGKMTELRAKEIVNRYNLDDSFFAKLCLKLGYDINSGKMLSDGITALYSRSVIIDIFCNDLINYGLNITQKELEVIFDEVSNIFYNDMVKYTKPINSAIAFIKELRKTGVKIGIVTSDSLISTNLTLKHFKWEPLFDVVIGRESSSETKESGIPVKLALEKLRANSVSTVMIGDAPMDYKAAINAGVQYTILVSTGQISEDELLKVSPYCVNSLAELCIK